MIICRGEIYASARTALLSDMALRRSVQQRMNRRQSIAERSLEEKSQSRLWPMWISGLASKGHLDGNGQTARLDKTGSGMALGLDGPSYEGAFAGFVLGSETWQLSNGQARNSQLDVTAYDAGLYMGSSKDGFHFNVGAISGMFELDPERDIWVAGATSSLKGMAKAHYHGHKMQLFGEVAKDIPLGTSVTLSPYVQWAHHLLYTSAAHENGTKAALDIAEEHDRLFSIPLGLRGFYDVPTATPIHLYADAGFVHHERGRAGTRSHHLREASKLLSLPFKGLIWCATAVLPDLVSTPI